MNEPYRAQSPAVRFFTAPAYLAFFALMALSASALAGFLILIAPDQWVGWFLGACGLWLGFLGVVEWRVPAIEIENDHLVIRVARLRKPVRVPLREVGPFTVERDLLGLRLRGSEALGRIAAPELVRDRGQGLIVSCRQLSGRDRERLEAILREAGLRSA